MHDIKVIRKSPEIFDAALEKRGEYSKSSKIIALDIKRTNTKDQKTVKTELGKKSLTKFNIDKKMNGYTKMTAIPHTGRRHQIRFHCLDAGYPIIGDKKYFLGTSKTDARRLMLHARQIAFRDNEEMVSLSLIHI